MVKEISNENLMYKTFSMKFILPLKCQLRIILKCKNISNPPVCFPIKNVLLFSRFIQTCSSIKMCDYLRNETVKIRNDGWKFPALLLLCCIYDEICLEFSHVCAV